ncbi:hypothetical protein AADZ90_017035 [Aestuariibius sp. 2305UL40-4]|uniref:hypothetical protein n=1 Tax=Aestuariibius violaceus TaxID=3234132 RepID=UPI00345EA3BF
MTDQVLLPELGGAELIELARMLLARKLMPEDRRGTLSPMVNAPLAQCAILHEQLPLSLAEWLPRLKDQFIQEMSDTRADPSLSQHLSALEDYAARTNLIRQYFLPFSTAQGIDTSSALSMAEAFSETARFAPPVPDMGPLYSTTPQGGSIALPRPFASSIFDQILIGRNSHIHLETRRRGETNEAASDAVIRALMKVVAEASTSPSEPQPFHTPKLRSEDFAKSFAYTQMMELGFSREEMMAALAPWELVD